MAADELPRSLWPLESSDLKETGTAPGPAKRGPKPQQPETRLGGLSMALEARRLDDPRQVTDRGIHYQAQFPRSCQNGQISGNWVMFRNLGYSERKILDCFSMGYEFRISDPFLDI
ncbi:MAG: hypothetical protein ACR2P3_02075 [Geminicoccaceae bacterium]